MKKILLSAAILLSAFSLLAKSVTLTACEWEPYTGEKLTQKGLLSDLAAEALKKEGYTVEIKFYPWARAFETAKNGAVDGLLGASFSTEREAYFSYPEKLWTNKIGIWCLKSNPLTSFISLEKLAPAKIGVLNGSFLIEDIKKISGLEPDLVSDVGLNIKKLSAGRMPYFLESSDNINTLLSGEFKEYKDQIRMLQPAYKEDDLFVVFAKNKQNWQQLTKDFDNGLKKMKSSGEYKKIIDKHKM